MFSRIFAPRIVDKYAWLSITVCIDVEVVSSSGDTSAYKLTIVLEVHSEDLFTACRIHVPHGFCGTYILAVPGSASVPRDAFISNRHVDGSTSA